MQGDYELKHAVPADDPNRCKATIATQGQCIQRAVDGSDYCPIHGGNKALKKAEAENVSRYRINQWQSRISSFAGDSRIKSLHEELGMLRVLLEEKFNACKSATDLIIQAGPISELILKVEKITKTIHELDKDLENIMEKQQMLVYADRIVGIIAEHVKDDNVRFEISKKIAALFIPEEKK
jgi:uncharacterized Zn finger protein (UPF0148 family)